MIPFKPIIISTICGLALGIVGPQLIGILAAVPIPLGFFNLFDNPRVAISMIDFISAFLALGLPAAGIGYALGLRFERWPVNCSICYVSFLVTLSVNPSLSAESIVVAPYPSIDAYSLPTILLIPVLMCIAGYCAARSQPRTAI